MIIETIKQPYSKRIRLYIFNINTIFLIFSIKFDENSRIIADKSVKYLYLNQSQQRRKTGNVIILPEPHRQ